MIKLATLFLEKVTQHPHKIPSDSTTQATIVEHYYVFIALLPCSYQRSIDVHLPKLQSNIVNRKPYTSYLLSERDFSVINWQEKFEKPEKVSINLSRLKCRLLIYLKLVTKYNQPRQYRKGPMDTSFSITAIRLPWSAVRI
jgi:hypothetical protein